jgi:hypothetical protein
MLAIAAAMATLLKPAHKTGHRNSETACQNENWPPVFILILAKLPRSTSHSGYLSVQYIILFLANFFSWRLIT